MSDTKIRCALVYRLEAGNTVCLAKFDHAGEYESHGGAADQGALYGGRDSSYAEAAANVIENDPPSGLSEAGTLGGFKVVQSDMHQIIFGADSDAICKWDITARPETSSNHVVDRCCRDYWAELPVKDRDPNATGSLQRLHGKGQW